MIITFLNAKEFETINGKAKYLHAGLGVGRNVEWWKKDGNGRIYAKLSPIADPVYNGVSKEIKSDSFIASINRLFK